MSAQPKPIDVRPAKGGRLMTGPSAENAGIFNYTVKRDWRRVLDGEQRSEGYDIFCPNVDRPDAPSLNGEAVNLLVFMRHPNGQTGVVVGTRTKLYRYRGLDVLGYFETFGGTPENEQYRYFEDAATYFVDDPGVWTEIGSGFGGSTNLITGAPTRSIIGAVPGGAWSLRVQGLTAGQQYFYTGGSETMFCGFKQIPLSVTAIEPGAFTAQADTLYGLAWPEGPQPEVTATITPYNASNPYYTGQSKPRRWEAVVINGYLVLNNGLDLPVTYRLDQERVEPIYELREQGIASVGTIANHMGILVCCDIQQISSDAKLAAVMKGAAPYGAFTDTANLNRYQWRMIWSLPNQPRRFGASFPCTVDPTKNTVDTKYPVQSVEVGRSLMLTGAGAQGGNLTVTPLWITQSAGTKTSILVADRAVTVAASSLEDAVTAAKKALELATKAATACNSTLVVAKAAMATARDASNAAPNDTDLKQAYTDASAKVDTAQAAKTAADKAEADAQTAVAAAEKALLPIDAYARAADTVDSITGQYEDLQDDGSAIIRALSLGSYLIVYKRTAIFIGQYTGQAANPFSFYPPIPIPEGAALQYRNTLICTRGQAHVWAGVNGFYRFDMVNRIPIEVPELIVCRDVFFNAVNPADDDLVFAVDNTVTREVWFCFPSAGPDKALRYDYEFNSISTSSEQYTAAVVVQLGDLPWFIMGTPDGKVLRYGLTAASPVSSGSTTLTVTETTATADADIFTKDMVGCSVQCQGGKIFAITGYTDARNVTILGEGPATPERFTVLPAIWHRDGGSYDSILEAGVESFGSMGSLKNWSQYVLFWGSKSPGTPIKVAFRGGRNPDEVKDIYTKTITPPKNLTTLVMEQYFLGDRLTVSGKNNPVSVSGRQLTVAGVDSRNFGRQP